MSDTPEVVITKIPIIGLDALRCIVRVDENGDAFDSDGEPVGGDRQCGRDGYWLLGSAPICDKHWPEVCALGGLDPDDILAEWKANL